MASHYWLKLYHEILHDPKMGQLSDRLWRRCIEMFLLAGDTDNEGHLPPVTDMAWALRTNAAELAGELVELAGLGILSENGDRWHVTKWTERQSASSSTERVQRFRKREQREKVRGSKYKGVKWQEPLWKDFPESPGVYAIHCHGMGMIYVGASRNLQQRVRQHLSNIATGLHAMSSDFERYGPESISTEILEQTNDESQLRALEEKHLAQYVIQDLYNTEEVAKRHRNWPGSELNPLRNVSETIRSTDTDIDTDIDTEQEVDTEQTTSAAAAGSLQNLLDIGMDSDTAQALADEHPEANVRGWCAESKRRKLENPPGWVRSMLVRGHSPPAAYDNGLAGPADA